jgi:hypothetical protein
LLHSVVPYYLDCSAVCTWFALSCD